MRSITLSRPTEQEFASTYASAHGRSNLSLAYKARLCNIEAIEYHLNKLVELTADKRAGRVHGEYDLRLRNLLDNIEFFYVSTDFLSLLPAEQELFIQLMRDFGIHEVSAGVLHDALTDVTGFDASLEVPIGNIEVHRPLSLEGQLGDWESLELMVSSEWSDSFMAFRPPTDNDPLGLLARGGFSLTVARKAGATMTVSDTELMLHGVTVALQGVYKRVHTHYRYASCTLNTDTNVLYTVKCIRDGSSGPYTSVKALPYMN